ncbi:sensor histidine kinase [Noviherbaspirillum denitrificans]|uniref:histidine kinase n=1 Tax=Noviherbaspirillum denitrificans TaxID=1968433 RepID=A0A254TP34_9BURK|nr:HAMP domain-containing sensor histidine kinase [Noviherbaspirillum denitrificans]OWW21478.1 histidine kinase [Noviherbaspirillum denitrificans]
MDTRLAAAVVHDIKNALGVLEGMLAELAQQPTREQAGSAQAMCATLHERLIGFLTLYKASSQGLKARVDAVNPEDFLKAVIRDNPSGRADLKINIQAEGMPVLGFFDENLVGLAISAALQNAARFARTTIDVGCAMDPSGDLAFTVRDDGPGLGAKEDKPSTGLGTALCTAIAEAHRKGDRIGSVTLEDHSGGGAVFTLRLP